MELCLLSSQRVVLVAALAMVIVSWGHVSVNQGTLAQIAPRVSTSLHKSLLHSVKGKVKEFFFSFKYALNMLSPSKVYID